MIRRREILALPLLGVVPRAIAQNFHCGILVVGAGGAGLAAALEASAYSDSVDDRVSRQRKQICLLTLYYF